MSKAEKSVTPKRSPETERVMLVLERLWAGNKTAMARDLGVSTSLINKVAYGERSPGRKLLNALANHPTVDEIWLLTGQGEPFTDKNRVQIGSSSSLLPVADHVLPGSPDKHQAHFVTRIDLLSAEWARPSRYLLRVGSGWSIVQEAGSRIAAGDLLLVETEPIWVENPAVLPGKLVVANLSATNTPDFQVVPYDGFSTHSHHFKQPASPQLGRKFRGLDFSEEESLGDSDSKSRRSRDTRTPPIRFDSIMGVALLLIRL